MKTTYFIKGITCSGCVNSVQTKLLAVKGVNRVTADLQTGEAIIDADILVPFQDLSLALEGTKYSLHQSQSEAQAYQFFVQGMTCTGCGYTVERLVSELPGVSKVHVDLKEQLLSFHADKYITERKINEQLASTHYRVSKDRVENDVKHAANRPINQVHSGIFYCPMHCEGEKTYDQAGDCPVCGMDLVEEVGLQVETEEWSCPMHPEIKEKAPGSCSICGMDLVPSKPAASAEEQSYLKLLKKFKLSVVFTLPIFLIAMSEMVHGNPLYKIMPQSAWNWVQLFLALPVVFYTCWMFFQRAYKSIVTWHLNMFTLIGIGAGVAFVFSVVALLFPTVFPNEFRSMTGSVHVYFEATTVILTLVLLGQLLEAKAHSKTNEAVKSLIKLSPKNAIKLVNGEEQEVPIIEVMAGDLLRVKPGGQIPVDGIVQQGKGTIDESMISGEPVAVEKQQGDSLTAGTINGNTSFIMEAQKVGNETVLAQIIEMVNQASRSKAPIQKLADKISGFFVPIVVIVSAVTFVLWVVYGPEPVYVYALINAIAVLIIACPCALGLATPMSVMVGVGKGAQNGVLIKNAEALEKLQAVDTLVIDKTGTITTGKPTVNTVKSLHEDWDENSITEYMYALNKNSEHPLAKATTNFAEQKGVKLLEATNFESVTGKGVRAMVAGVDVYFGNRAILELANSKPSKEAMELAETYQLKGMTVSFLVVEATLVGFVVISDEIKKSSLKAVQELQQLGIEVIMLTGDNAKTAKAVAKEVGISQFKAELLPGEKLQEVKQLQATGKVVAMAGDGINDSPALAQSDVGLAMGTGTDVAIKSASVTLVNSDLLGVVKAIKLSRKVMANIKQNLFFALVYNLIGVPIAAGILFPLFGILLSPMLAALAMSFSSVSVIANALRLKRISIN